MLLALERRKIIAKLTAKALRDKGDSVSLEDHIKRMMCSFLCCAKTHYNPLCYEVFLYKFFQILSNNMAICLARFINTCDV